MRGNLRRINCFDTQMNRFNPSKGQIFNFYPDQNRNYNGNYKQSYGYQPLDHETSRKNIGQRIDTSALRFRDGIKSLEYQIKNVFEMIKLIRQHLADQKFSTKDPRELFEQQQSQF